MPDQPWRGAAVGERHLQRVGDQLGAHVIGHRPAITFLDTPPNGWTFDGGRGNDTFSGPARTVDGGAGNDRIDVVGDTPSSVTCGAGFDVVWADSSDVLSADCERRIETSTPPVLPGVEEAVARARALLNHVPHPDPASS
jgi:hypothetical protein